MQLIVYIYYWLLFFNNDNLKYTTISQRRSLDHVSLIYIFFFFHRFYHIFANSYTQRNILFIIYIVYRLLKAFAM